MARTPKKYLIQDQIILEDIYSKVNEVIEHKLSALKSCIERFVHRRQEELYDYAPVERIFWKKGDVDDFFKSIGINLKDISHILPKLYYWKEDELQACKDEFSLTCLMCLRYLLKNKKDAKLIELVSMYLSFSGKFYASCHYDLWKQYTPKREVMDYTVNYMLSNKFDLVKYKSVWGAVKSLTTTWLDTYKTELCGDITDERIVYLIHQLRNRIHAFLKNIAIQYYEAYEKKLYLNAESDNYDKENYRIANNNSTIISSITENTMIYFANNQINITFCFASSGPGVDPYAIKAIFETIINDNQRLNDLRFIINILLVDFTNRYPEEKDITGPKFIAHSIAMKPNTKDKNIIAQKNIILGWLNTNDRYRNTKTPATKNNYYKAILSYIALTINAVNKGG